MDELKEHVPRWLEAELRRVMALFADQDFTGLEAMSGGKRLSADEMNQAVSEYGRTLVFPPDEYFGRVNVGRIEVGEPAYWACLPFWTVEEGRSDLELQLTVYDPPKGSMRCTIEIDNIRVP